MSGAALWLEKYYPLATALIVTFISTNINFSLLSNPNLMSNILIIISIFIGFVGTLAGIILSSNGKAIAFMKSIDKLSVLMSYIWRSLHIAFIFVFYSILLEVYPVLEVNKTWVSYLWVFLGTYALLQIHRAITRSATLLKSVANENL